MASGFDLEETGATFGAVVTGLDVEDDDPRLWAELHAAWLTYALLIFPGIDLSADQQVAFAERFGPLRAPRFAVGNIKADGSLLAAPRDQTVIDMLLGNGDWHTDNTFFPVQTKGTVYAAEITSPTGGETGWADVRAAYDALEPQMRERLEGLTARHSIRHGQARRGLQIMDDERFVWPGPLRPLIKTHPETGRKSLLIGRHAHSVSGLDEAASRDLLEELVAFTCQPPRVYFYAWKPGDAVLWDNRCLMHCAMPWDIAGQPRLLWHTPIAGDPVTEAAIG